MGKKSWVTGISLGLASPEHTKEIIQAINQGLKSGILSPNVGTAYKLAEGPNAHRDIINPPAGATGKIVLHPWD